MNNNFVEKRESVRVVISVDAKVRLVGEKEAERLKAGEAASDGQVHFPGWGNRLLPEQIPLDPRLASFLMQIDEKLDRLLAILEDEKECQDMLDVRDTVDISGTGIRLMLGERLDIGQFIHVTLKVPEMPLGKISAYGKVIRVNEEATDAETVYEVGIRFLNLSRQEQEAIISYTFWKQREYIRVMKTRL